MSQTIENLHEKNRIRYTIKSSILDGAEDNQMDPAYNNKVCFIPFAYHLLPMEGLAKVAAVMRKGERTGRGNDDWRAVGIKEQLNHAMSHIIAYLSGRNKEHHLANAGCRILMALDMDITEKLPNPVPSPGPIRSLDG